MSGFDWAADGPPGWEWRRYYLPSFFAGAGRVGPCWSGWYLRPSLEWSRVLPRSVADLFASRVAADAGDVSVPRSAWVGNVRAQTIVHAAGMTLRECEYCGESAPLVEGAPFCFACGTRCDECGQTFAPNAIVEVARSYADDDSAGEYCESCVGVCSSPRCDNPAHPGRDHCPECRENLVMCEGCDEWTDADRATFVDVADAYQCDACLSEYFRWCDECDQYIHARNYREDERACRECVGDVGGVHAYSYKPRPRFHADDTDTAARFGLEVECECVSDGATANYAADLVARHVGDLAYCKRDGSLDDGVEIVTHPMSLEYLQRAQGFRDLCETLVAEGYRAWNTTTCGLHVHISRAAFASHAHAFTFALFWYRNAPYVATFSGRTRDRLRQYARLTDHQGDGRDVPTLAHKVRHQGTTGGERYTAVNLLNAATIEVRVFRGTLAHSAILGCVELVHAVWAYTATLRASDVREGRLAWKSLLEWCESESARANLYHHFLTLNDRRFNRVSA